ncbi:MAG: MerR family transcriptional regulator [Candidatus Caldarchaeum sp.]
MASISLDEAAARIGVSPQTIEAWAEQGLLTIHQLVEEDELRQVAESLGWLRLSAEHWDGSEE